jgi:RsiW-degrading membrane proteinase PrsW (M82 family)
MLLFVLLLIFIGIAVALAWFLISHDRGAREPIAMLWLALGLGLLGAVLAGALEGWLVPANDLLPGTPYGTLLATSLSIGVIEEGCKFLPLAFLLYKRPYFNEHTDGVIYFALAGIGFGLPENILYTLQFGTKTGAVRLVMTPFFHAATTGLVGYYLVKRKLAGQSPFGIWLPLAGLMVLHGLYDFGLSSGSTLYAMGSLAITLGTAGALFVTFLHAQERDQDLGLSVVGHNAFCRSCGYPNPRRHLYCVHCGKNA